MKLSKKIVILFMTISLVTVTLYMISMGFVSKYLYSGEVTRISGIASGCINRVNGEVSKVIGKGNDYTSLLSSADTYNEKLNETNALEALGIINKFRNDNIDFKVVLDSNFNEKEKFESKDLSDRSKIEGLLKKAIDNKEFVVNFQPIYSVNKKKIIGAEALVRWVRDGRVIYPDKFIHIAKRTGDIYEIDNYVLREACIFCKEKRKEGFKDFQVSVNASYRFLKQHKFIDKLKNVLEEVGLEPDGLKLEITEDEVLDDAKRIVELLKEIKALGVLIALDDFGVGYSSFSYIKILPIDTIKIDRSLL